MLPKAISLIGTGAALGVFHVLTGPDHLSAIATLSANVNNGVQSFFLGVRWGVGHSTGLLSVGIILILVTSGRDADTVDVPEGVSRFFESLVGIFMILLGAYGMRRAWNKKPKNHKIAYGAIQTDPDVGVVDDASDNCADLEVDDVEIPSVLESYHNHAGAHSCCAQSCASKRNQDENRERGSCRQWFDRLTQSVSARTMAVCAGIIHGLAGPGGVLGIIPAVQLHDWKLATIYLGTFCLCSTITMGVFALLYGTCSSRVGRGTARREFVIECISAGLSIVVGLTWLTLLSLGKLEDVFP